MRSGMYQLPFHKHYFIFKYKITVGNVVSYCISCNFWKYNPKHVKLTIKFTYPDTEPLQGRPNIILSAKYPSAQQANREEKFQHQQQKSKTIWTRKLEKDQIGEQEGYI